MGFMVKEVKKEIEHFILARYVVSLIKRKYGGEM